MLQTILQNLFTLSNVMAAKIEPAVTVLSFHLKANSK